MKNDQTKRGAGLSECEAQIKRVCLVTFAVALEARLK